MDQPRDERLFALCSTLVSEGLAFLSRYLKGKHYVRRIEDLPSVEWSDDGMPQFRFFGNEKYDLFATSLKLFIEMSIDRYVHIVGLTSFEPENYLRVYLPLESGLLK